MRAGIDISEIEAETKIRAKYLRALENEEWDLLPGPTYVKSFLKTYAEALGLDARLLVEEFKLRHERLSDSELSRPIGPSATAAGRRRPAPPGLPPGVIIAGCVLALLAGLFVLGKLTGDDDGDKPNVANTTTTQATTTTGSSTTATSTTPRKRTPARPRNVRLTLTAKAPVYVCLRAAGNRTLVRGETLAAGDRRGPFRSSSYKLNLGNNSVTLRINGKAVAVPASSGAIGMQITRSGRSSLPQGQRPECL